MLTKKSLSQKGKSGKSSFAKRYKNTIKRAYPDYTKNELKLHSSRLSTFIANGLKSEDDVVSSLLKRVRLMEGRFIA